MPTLERPDGAKLHWEARGEGSLILIAHQIMWSYPAVYAELIDDLAADHRVVTYDARGCGSSSREGPYDLETDIADLCAVLEAASGRALVIAVGYGFNLVVRVATRRPDLISDVLALGPAAAVVLPRAEWRNSDVMAGSDSVVEMLLQMMNTDPRAAVRMVVSATNPELGADELRERVDFIDGYISNESALARAELWLEDDPVGPARDLGAHLWILHGETEALFEGELGERVAELLPKARIEQLEYGPVSRPDLSAAWIREMAAGRT